MTELVELYDAHSTAGGKRTAQSKAKKEAEEKAGKQLRDASMKSLIPCEGLVDISALDDTTVREKQGQHREKYGFSLSTVGFISILICI